MGKETNQSFSEGTWISNCSHTICKTDRGFFTEMTWDPCWKPVVRARVYIWALRSAPLSVCPLVAHSWYRSFTVILQLVLVLRLCFSFLGLSGCSTQGPLYFHTHCLICLSTATKEACGDFDWDQFRKKWHLSNIKTRNP